MGTHSVRWTRTLVALAWVMACGSAPESETYQVRGVVQEVQPDYDQVVIEHEDIPGLMPSMTMNFDVAEPGMLEALEPGQAVVFQLEASPQSYRIVEIAALGGAGTVGDGPRVADLALEADPAPPFELVDQDGQALALADLRGKVVLLDFIYTRCPGPCPSQTGFLASVQRALTASERDRVAFVSISFDPARDTPDALRSYAEARGADLSGWAFVTGAPEVVGPVLDAYGVATQPAEKGDIDHLLVTFVIDGEGEIARRYVGTSHERGDLLRDIRRLLADGDHTG